MFYETVRNVKKKIEIKANKIVHEDYQALFRGLLDSLHSNYEVVESFEEMNEGLLAKLQLDTREFFILNSPNAFQYGVSLIEKAKLDEIESSNLNEKQDLDTNTYHDFMDAYLSSGQFPKEIKFNEYRCILDKESFEQNLSEYYLFWGQHSNPFYISRILETDLQGLSVPEPGFRSVVIDLQNSCEELESSWGAIPKGKTFQRMELVIVYSREIPEEVASYRNFYRRMLRLRVPTRPVVVPPSLSPESRLRAGLCGSNSKYVLKINNFNKGYELSLSDSAIFKKVPRFHLKKKSLLEIDFFKEMAFEDKNFLILNEV